MDLDLSALGHVLINGLAVRVLQHLQDNPDKLQIIAVFVVDHLIAAIAATKPVV